MKISRAKTFAALLGLKWVWSWIWHDVTTTSCDACCRSKSQLWRRFLNINVRGARFLLETKMLLVLRLRAAIWTKISPALPKILHTTLTTIFRQLCQTILVQLKKIMAFTARCIPRLTASIRFAFRPRSLLQTRSFSVCSRCRTDGVFRELTEMRTRVPFIEAFKKHQEEAIKSQPMSTVKVERDLNPKTMSDSYTRIVSHVTVSRGRSRELMQVDIASRSRPMASGLVY